MRRRYTRDRYLALVDALRAEVPGIALTTDMIVGFPGETAADFEETLSLTAERPVSTACSRSSTRSARTRWPPSATRTMCRRRRRRGASWRCRRCSGTFSWTLHDALVGQTVDVLVDAAQPAARDGTLGPHDRQHRGELPGRRRARIGTARAGHDPPRGPQQPLGRGGARPMQIEMTIKGLMVDPVTNMPIIILRDEAGDRVLPIWVGDLRGERHRAADRERRDAAADDARPAAQRHPGPRRRGAEGGRLRPQGEHVLRGDPPGGAGRAGPDRRPAERRDCAGAADEGARSSSRKTSSTTPRRWTGRPSGPTASGCRNGSRASTATNSANTRCECPPTARNLRNSAMFNRQSQIRGAKMPVPPGTAAARS